MLLALIDPDTGEWAELPPYEARCVGLAGVCRPVGPVSCEITDFVIAQRVSRAMVAGSLCIRHHHQGGLPPPGFLPAYPQLRSGRILPWASLALEAEEEPALFAVSHQPQPAVGLTRREAPVPWRCWCLVPDQQAGPQAFTCDSRAEHGASSASASRSTNDNLSHIALYTRPFPPERTLFKVAAPILHQ